jgi:hypothetical protein
LPRLRGGRHDAAYLHFVASHCQWALRNLFAKKSFTSKCGYHPHSCAPVNYA